MLNRFLVLATFVVLIGCQTTSSPEATKPTWDRGYLHAFNVAGNKYCGYPMIVGKTQTCMKNFSAEARKTGRKYPVVIFLHGCRKFDGEYGSWFASMGYIVFSPDSFQRVDRRSKCTGRGSKHDIYAMRRAEITYARQQIRKIDWVDQSRVFLVGKSEGGRAVTNYTGPGFKAKIILSYDCDPDPLSGSLPVLNLVGENDRDWGSGLCSVSGPKSFAFNVPNRAHQFLDDKFATKKIKMFLGQFK